MVKKQVLQIDSNKKISKPKISKFDLENVDCLEYLSNYKGAKFDLVYLDPPFFLDRMFSLEASSSKVSFQGGWEDQEIEEFCNQIGGTGGSVQLVKYLSWLYPRLKLIHSNMSQTGSLFLHIGIKEGPYVSLLLDHIFGFKNWRSTITWQRSHPHNNMKKSLGNVSDYIYYYTKSSKFTFNVLHTKHDAKYLKNSFNNSDERGSYALAPIVQEKSRKGHFYEYNGVTPKYGWRVKEDKLEKLDKDKRIHWGTNRAYKKVYIAETSGAALQNIWSDIYNITRTDLDKRRYPTQKPLKLLERIVELSTVKGDLVYDPFCGSGTTIVAAVRMGRKALGNDISVEAIKVAKSRLQELSNSD